MKWSFVLPLESESSIERYETLTKYMLPASFKECVRRFNGGYPSDECFDTDKAEERAMKSLLSFNQETGENVWTMYRLNCKDYGERYIPFAIDNFGNLICFDRTDDSVVFLDDEVLEVEYVADSFDDFIDALYTPAD